MLSSPKKRDFQCAGDAHVRRNDHVWTVYKGRWTCVLCGGLVPAGKQPPKYPTPESFVPEDFVVLTPELRSLCPYDGFTL